MRRPERHYFGATKILKTTFEKKDIDFLMKQFPWICCTQGMS